ncbi:MAG: hypothetical protein GY796_30095 [Chloroflexi bacterium]|nr:hypothetical protein [Chloroflexota bacterium]
MMIFFQPQPYSKFAKPNQGIYISFRNATKLTFLLSTFIIMVCLSLVLVIVFPYADEIEVTIAVQNLMHFSILPLYFVVPVTFLYLGGISVFQHYVLRFILARQGMLPFFRDKRMITFLDEMVDHILLRRVGGGWIFIHRALLEHFSAQHPDLPGKESIS